MALTKYDFDVEDDFPNQAVNIARLDIEIRASEIVTALDHTDVAAGTASIWFKDALSAGDETVLGTVVAAHSGEMLPDPTIKVEEQKASRQSDKALVVAFSSREGTETTAVTHDMADQTTWFGQSVRVEEEVLTDSGDGLTWESEHANWIDLTHGKLFMEDRAVALDPDGYAVVVTVDDVEKTQRTPFATDGGDYAVNYTTGKVVFFESQAGNAVKASFNYANGSRFVIKPPTGKAFDIEAAEGQFTKNIVLNDSIVFEVFGWVEVFAPQLWDGFDPPGPYPAHTPIPLDKLRYKKMQNLIDEAQGAFPVVPAIGGEARGTQSDVHGFPFRYGTARRVWAKYGMELHIYLENDQPVGSNDDKQAYATATLYYVEKSEAALEA